MDKSIDEKIELVRSLFARKKLHEGAVSRFKAVFPQASDSAVDTLAFHLFVDGHESLLDMLCHLESFMRGDVGEIDSGLSFHVLYHLHNYELVRQLIPYNSQDAIEDIDEMMNLVKEEDPDIKGILEMLNELKDKMKGGSKPLSIEPDV